MEIRDGTSSSPHTPSGPHRSGPFSDPSPPKQYIYWSSPLYAYLAPSIIISLSSILLDPAHTSLSQSQKASPSIFAAICMATCRPGFLNTDVRLLDDLCHIMTSPVQQFDASQISDEMLKASDDGLPHPEHQRHEVCHRCNEHKDKSTRYQRCLDQINEGRLHHDHLYVDHYCQDQLDICISKISRKPIQHGTKIFSEEPAATEHESQDTCSIDTPISTEVATSNLDVINEEEEAITPSQPSTEVPPDYSRPDQVSSDPLQPVGPPRMRGTSIGQALAAVDRRKRGSSLSQPLRPGDPRRRGKSLGYQATHVSLLELEFRRQLILVDIFGPRDHFPMDPIPISSLQTVSPPVERKEDVSLLTITYGDVTN